MNEPIFKVKATVVPSIKQYFCWKSGVRNTYTLTTCSVERINGIYEFYASATDQYGNVRDYFRNQTNTDLYIVIQSSTYGETSVYISEYTGDITTVNAWDCDLIRYYTGAGIFSEVYYSEPQVEMTTMPTVTTSNKGSGNFSFKLDDGDWSADATIAEFTVENLTDGSNHSFDVREKLVDESYGDSVSCAFSVAFSSGTIQPQVKFATIATDLTNQTVTFSLLAYESKLLSGLTRDAIGVSGMYLPSGFRNGALYYRNGALYLWYSSRFSRWLITAAAQFDNESGMYEYYECYLYANDQTDAVTWTSGTWYGGMNAEMSISGTAVWGSGIYHVIPIGTGVCRYQVNGGSYMQLDADVTSFSLAMALGNTYEVKISELLDNGLWSPETTVAISCTRLPAPQLTTGNGITESDGGRNVTLKWTGWYAGNFFNGVALMRPAVWDSTKTGDITGPESTPGKTFAITNADKTAAGSYCAVKLLPNTRYWLHVPTRDGNVQNSIYRPDLSKYSGIHDNEHNWEEVNTGKYGGLWIYGVHDQGSWGNWTLACAPVPEEIQVGEIGATYAAGTGQVCGLGIYRYRIDGCVWSTETQVVSALQMFQLPTGEHTIALQEKSGNGVWSETASLTLTVTNGAEAGTGSGGSGITVPEGAYLVLVDAAGKEYLWDGVSPTDDLSILTVT